MSTKFEESTLIVICSYCLAFMGIKDGKGTCGVSHGVCSHCSDEVKKSLKKK